MKINYTFKDNTLLKLALTHPSMLKHKNKKQESYERLEFLGDSVLGMVIADLIYNYLPGYSEGDLSIIHSNLVSSKILTDVAVKIDLGSALILDKGEERSNGRTNPNNLEDALEALIAAIYIDKGFEAAKEFISELWLDYIKQAESYLVKDPKSLLQEWAQKNKFPIPDYKTINKTGLDHSPVFKVKVTVSSKLNAIGKGSTVKEASKAAALTLLEKINQNE